MNVCKRLDKIRRFVATLIGFVFFGVFGGLFQLVLLPYVLHPKRGELAQQLKVRRLVGRVWYTFVRYLIASGVLSVRFNGVEKLGRSGQLILANHPSLLDVVLLIAHVPNVNCIVKKDLLHNPTMRAQILAGGYIPNDESLEMLDKVAAAFAQGESILLFPEGTRTGWDGEIKLHRGAVSMGLRSAKVITPVVIKQTPPNFKKGQPWYRIPETKVHYE
ncbi:MAG: lysophospholipid acyltransferase family protein, partial [Neisseria sp.]|nr:lysophospholipid acyltransferase family protein [Neisseria sp.]